MKFILLFCILIVLFTFNTLQSSKPKLSLDCINDLGKNIPVYSFVKDKEVLVAEAANDNHFLISAIVPDCEMICK